MENQTDMVHVPKWLFELIYDILQEHSSEKGWMRTSIARHRKEIAEIDEIIKLARGYLHEN